MNRKKLSIILTGAMIASCAYAIPANANSMPKNKVSITANKEIDTINPTYNSNVIKQINSIATSKNKIGPNVAGAFVKQHWYVYMGNMTFKAPNKTVADAFNGATVSITEAGNSFGGGTLVLDNKNTLVANDITPGQLTTLGKHPMTITISKNGEILYTTTTSIDCAPLTYFTENFLASNLKAGESYSYYSNGVKLGEVAVQNGWREYTGLPWSCNAKTKNININLNKTTIIVNYINVANNKIIKKTFIGVGMPGTLTSEKIKNPTGYSPDYTTVNGVPSINGVSISKFPVKNEVVDVYLLQGSKPTTTIKVVDGKIPNGIIPKIFGKKDETIIYNIKKYQQIQ